LTGPTLWRRTGPPPMDDHGGAFLCAGECSRPDAGRRPASRKDTTFTSLTVSGKCLRIDEILRARLLLLLFGIDFGKLAGAARLGSPMSCLLGILSHGDVRGFHSVANREKARRPPWHRSSGTAADFEADARRLPNRTLHAAPLVLVDRHGPHGVSRPLISEQARRRAGKCPLRRGPRGVLAFSTRPAELRQLEELSSRRICDITGWLARLRAAALRPSTLPPPARGGR